MLGLGAKYGRRGAIMRPRGLAERKPPLRILMFYAGLALAAILIAWAHHH